MTRLLLLSFKVIVKLPLKSVTTAFRIRLFLSTSLTLAPIITSISSDTVPEIRRCALAGSAIMTTAHSKNNFMILFMVSVFIGLRISECKHGLSCHQPPLLPSGSQDMYRLHSAGHGSRHRQRDELLRSWLQLRSCRSCSGP